MTTTETVSIENRLLCRVLNNPRRMKILHYLEKAKYATNEVLSRVLKLRPSQVSKDVKLLLQAGLLEKEILFRSTLYKTTDKWSELHAVLKL